jgi:DNA-binding protein Fis
MLESFCRRLMRAVPSGATGDVHATVTAMVEGVLLRTALDEGGCQVRAARLLGLHRNTIRRKLAELERAE